MKYKRQKVLKKVSKLLKKAAKNDNFSFFLAALRPINDALISNGYTVSGTIRNLDPLEPNQVVKIWSHDIRKDGSRPSTASFGVGRTVWIRFAQPSEGFVWVLWLSSGHVELVSRGRVELA